MDLSILGLCSRGIEELGCVWHVQGCKLPNIWLALCWHYLPDSKKVKWVTVTPKVKKTRKNKANKKIYKTMHMIKKIEMKKSGKEKKSYTLFEKGTGILQIKRVVQLHHSTI